MPTPGCLIHEVIFRQLELLGVEIPPLLTCGRLNDIFHEDGFDWGELQHTLSEAQLQAIIAHNAATLRMCYFLEGKIPEHMV